MTRERDIDLILDHWFADRPTEVPDRVLDTVADRIARQPQHAAWRLPWRDSHVNSYLKYAAAVAAVVLVAAVGFAILRPSSGANVGAPPASAAPSPSPVSPAPSPSPAASASPSTAPSTSVVFPTWFTPSDSGAGAGILPAGNVTTGAFVPGFTFTVPEGWVNSHDEFGFYALFPDTPANQAEFAASEALANEIFMGPHDSPYFVCDAWEDHRGTSAEMVASMVANEALATSEPVDVTIGGLTGKQIDVRLDPAWTESCPGDPPTFDLGDGRTRAILLDTINRGVIVIIFGSLHSAGHDAFLAEAMPIVESFQFDLTP